MDDNLTELLNQYLQVSPQAKQSALSSALMNFGASMFQRTPYKRGLLESLVVGANQGRGAYNDLIQQSLKNQVGGLQVQDMMENRKATRTLNEAKLAETQNTNQYINDLRAAQTEEKNRKAREAEQTATESERQGYLASELLNPERTAEEQAVIKSGLAGTKGGVDAIGKLTGGTSKGGAVMAAAKQIMTDNPEMPFITAYSIAKQGLGTGITMQDGGVQPIQGAPGAAEKMSYGKESGKQAAERDYASQVEENKISGRSKAEFAAKQPKVRATLTALNRQWDIVDNTIDEAIKLVNPFTTGIGSSLKYLPATPQKSLSTKLETIQANIGFDKLQQMRNDSPTGGALGPVSDFENRLLQAVKGSLEQGLSSKELLKNLSNIKSDFQNMRKEVHNAYKSDYGEEIRRDTDVKPISKEAAIAELRRRGKIK